MEFKFKLKDRVRTFKLGKVEFPQLLMTSTTLNHNRHLNRLGYTHYSYNSECLVFVKSFTRRDFAVIIKPQNALYNHELKNLKRIIKTHSEKICFFFIRIPRNFNFTLEHAQIFASLQYDAGFSVISLFIPKSLSIAEIQDFISQARKKLPEKIIIPILDMDMPIVTFNQAYHYFENKFKILGFIYRRIEKKNKANYSLISQRTEEPILRLIFGITWRNPRQKQHIALPLLLLTLGFDGFVLVSPMAPINQLRRDAFGIHDIRKHQLKFFNEKTLCLEEAELCKDQIYYYPSHKGRKIGELIDTFKQTGKGAVFASTHDMHLINKILKELREEKISLEEILKKPALMQALYSTGFKFVPFETSQK